MATKKKPQPAPEQEQLPDTGYRKPDTGNRLPITLPRETWRQHLELEKIGADALVRRLLADGDLGAVAAAATAANQLIQSLAAELNDTL